MNWVLLTFLAILSRAVYGIATKVLSNRVKTSSVTQSFLLTTFAGLLTFVASPFIGGINFSGIAGVWGLVILMIVAQAFANILYFVGMKGVDAGTSQIAFSSIVIWGVILSVLFLGSKFSGIQILGIILLMFAILFMQYSKRALKFNRSALFIIGSAGLFSLFQIASAKLSVVIGAGAYLLLSYWGSSIIISLLFFKQIINELMAIKKNVKDISFATVFASSTTMLYFIFSYFAYRVAPDRGIVVILLTTQVIVAVILGILFLNEKQNRIRKLIAGVIAVVASVLIKS